MRVLVVEGDRTTARDIDDMLRAGGHEPVRDMRVSEVAILDFALGIETARRLRQRCRARIVLTTTDSDARALATIESFRPAAVLAKPFTAERLLATLQRAVS